MSPHFHLRIHQKILTNTKFLLKFFKIYPSFLHNLVQVSHRFTGFLFFSSMFLSPMLFVRVVTWELLLTRRKSSRLLQILLNMLLGNMIIHLLSVQKRQFGHLCSSLYSQYPLMLSCVLTNVQVFVILAFGFHVSFKGRPYLKNREQKDGNLRNVPKLKTWSTNLIVEKTYIFFFSGSNDL